MLLKRIININNVTQLIWFTTFLFKIIIYYFFSKWRTFSTNIN